MGKYSAKKRNGSKKQSFKKRKYNKKTGGMWPFPETENPQKENVVEGKASVIEQETDTNPETDTKSETDTKLETDKNPETTENTSKAQELENNFVNDLVKADNRDEVIKIINEYLEQVQVDKVN